MKKILSSVSIVLALFVSGCTGSETEAQPQPTVTVTEQPTPEVTPQDNNTQAFLQAMYERYPELQGQVTDQQMVEAGEEMCSLLDTGTPEQALVRLVRGADVQPEFAGYLMGASAVTLCPEHQSTVQAFVDKYAASGV